MKYKQLHNLTCQLYEKLDLTIKNFISNNNITLDCKVGCSLCCKTPSRIEVLPTEAFYIAEHLKNTLDEKNLNKLIENLYENKIKLQNKNLIECTKELTPCPLLIDESCSIYDIRPLVCRILLSDDYNICLEYNNFKGHIDGLLDTIFENKIYNQYINKIKELELFCEPIELNDALYRILTLDDSKDRYLKGDKDIFNKLLEVDILKNNA